MDFFVLSWSVIFAIFYTNLNQAEGVEMSSSDTLRKPGVTLATIVSIATSSYYHAQEDAMWMIIAMRADTEEVCDAIASVVNCSGYMEPRVRQRAAEKLLTSPVATNKHLARVLLHCTGEQRLRAGRKMLANGDLTERHIKWLGTWTPDLMGEPDTERKSFDRTVLAVLAP
jgi:hypothetical protein